ncbi:S1/P1 nuclease [Sphingomonas trueperi]
MPCQSRQYYQPLHSGNAHDRGGNDEIVTLRGQQTNLHTIWDSTLIDG